jgi:hypothetical protein
MPAASEPTAGAGDVVPVPRRFRPLGVRLAATLLGLALVTVTTVIWVTFPPEIRAQFTPFQKVTVLAVGLAFGICAHALARSRLDADAGGLTVVNGYRRRRFEWSQVLAVTLRPGSPWALLDLSDGTTVPAMGIQGSDGARAARQVRQLRGLVAHFSRTDRDD